jgi:hypothetical protein
LERKTTLPKVIILALVANFVGFAFALQQGKTNWITFFLGGSSNAFCPDSRLAQGEHCLPDFGIFYFLPRSNPWGLAEIRHPHPPLSQLAQTVFIDLTGLVGADYRQSQIVWQILLVGCIFMGMVVATQLSQGLSARTFVLPLFLLPTLGTFSVLWTGNSTALVVPFLALATNGIILNSKKTWIWVAITLALRPQFVLFLIALLLLGRYRQLIFATLATLALTASSLLYFSGNPIKLGASWLGNLVSFPFYASPFYFKPENLGIGRSIVKAPEFVINVFGSGLEANDSANNFEVFGSLLKVLNGNRGLVLAFLLLLGLVVLALIRKRLTSIPKRLSPFELTLVAVTSGIILPSTSFSYYLVALLPATALIVSDLLFRRDLSVTSSLSIFQKTLLISLLLCFPLPYSLLRSNEELGLNAIFESFGLILLMLLVTLIFRGFFGKERSCNVAE